MYGASGGGPRARAWWFVDYGVPRSAPRTGMPSSGCTEGRCGPRRAQNTSRAHSSDGSAPRCQSRRACGAVTGRGMVSPSSGSSSFASRTQAETRSQQRAHTVTCVPGHEPTLPSIPGHEPTLSLIPDRYIDYDFDRELAPSPSYVGPLVDHTTYYLPSTLCHTTYYLPSTLYHIPYYHLLPCATLLTIYPLPSASAPLCFHPAVPLPCASAPLCFHPAVPLP